MEITIAIDKLDKIGLEKVKEELAQKGLDNRQISIIEEYLSISGTNEEKLDKLRKILANNELAKAGNQMKLNSILTGSGHYYDEVLVDFTLARGLNYYTGIIFEVKAKGCSNGKHWRWRPL